MSALALAEHDRMIAAMLMPCVVVGVDLAAPAVKVSSGEWTSTWVRWHSLAAGKARHWRAPSLGEQGVLFNPSGQAGMGTFIPGLYGNAGAQPDNRDHVEVWDFEDGARLVYDWQAHSYTITLPTGTVAIKVGGTEVVVTDDAVRVKSGTISLEADAVAIKGAVSIDGSLRVTGNIDATGNIMAAGNSDNHHKH